MTGLLMLVATLVTAEALPDTKPYGEAYRLHEEEGRPLVVLVGATWCPACRTMSQQSVPSVAQNGMLKKVAFAVVDVDQKRQLSSQLMRGNSIPQLVMYYRTADGMRRAQLTGAQDAATIQKFIEKGIQAQEQAPARPRTQVVRVPTFRSSGGS